jgi:arginine/ornithine N-succinyltransferase beta subunit
MLVASRKDFAKEVENGENSGGIVPEKLAELFGETVIPMRVEAVEGFYRYRIAAMKGRSLAVRAMLDMIHDFAMAGLSVDSNLVDGGANQEIAFRKVLAVPGLRLGNPAQ